MQDFLTDAVGKATVRAAITLAVVGAMIYAGLAGKEVAPELVIAFGTVIGFYFGSETNGSYKG